MSESNFCYGQPRLENARVALEPFESSVHVSPFMEQVKAKPDFFALSNFPTVTSEEDFMNNFYLSGIQKDDKSCLYAIIDKTTTSENSSSERAFAGVLALSGTRPTSVVTEIGILIFPAFQRTHVSANAIGLVLMWIMDPPPAGGLGLRRVMWKCNAKHEASRRLALRMGFQFEGILRWDQVFERGTKETGLDVNELERRNGTKGEVMGRHSAVYSIVWDEWDETRIEIVEQMERQR